MINFFSNWIEQIAMAVVIASIFELILPKGNIKKYIKRVLGVYVVFCIISPFVNSSDLFDFENIDKYIEKSTSVSNEQVDQTSMDSRLEKLYIEEIEKDIEKKVEPYGYKVSKCKVDASLNSSSENPGIHSINLILTNKSVNSIEKIEINVDNKQNIQNKENIEYKEKIENTNQGETSSDAENIKEELAKNYEISKDIINVKINK